jgi:hypothetical protein
LTTTTKENQFEILPSMFTFSTNTFRIFLFSKFDLGVVNYSQHLIRVSKVVAGGNFSLSKVTIMSQTAATAVKAMQEDSKSCKNLF